MELVSFIAQNTHNSCINGLKSNNFGESIYKLLNFEILNEVAKSLTYLTGSKYVYTGRIVFENNEIEVIYKGADSSFPISLLISPNEEQNKNGLKFSGLSDEIKKSLNAEPKAEIVTIPDPISPEIANPIAIKVDMIIANIETLIQTPVQNPVVEQKVTEVVNTIDEIIEKETPKPLIQESPKIEKQIAPITKKKKIKKPVKEQVSTVINSIDKIIKEEEKQKKVNSLLSGLDKIIEEEQKQNEELLKKKKSSKKINQIIDIIEKASNE